MFVLDDWARPTAYGRHVLPGYGSATANGLGVTVSASTGQVVGYGVGASMDQAYLDSLGWPAK
ncbi:hypothetical protein D9V30_04005 [Mycetocola reblochoni]|uniref:Uncharacterized protein n=3 Tax=Mycetocola reblochoni TaxID=331618 RepID=A0A1R4IML6_9MICO|nr:hypothetical protein [Mycetocola reblochoni]RLP70650.1 hypothetical protein D9V30_04005 [Mycetocola reblochoni]SJN21009.1 hypothetical protein FM119_02560 [Mycetocola reblochoni REB411]